MFDYRDSDMANPKNMGRYTSPHSGLTYLRRNLKASFSCTYFVVKYFSGTSISVDPIYLPGSPMMYVS